MVLTEIALRKWQMNKSLVSEDCCLLFNFLVAFEANQGVTLNEFIIPEVAKFQLPTIYLFDTEERQKWPFRVISYSGD